MSASQDGTSQDGTSQEIIDRSTPRRGPCLVDGCSCKDPRIVSRRKAAYFAAVARSTGQTADRIVAVEPGWRIPTDLPTVHRAWEPTV